MRLFRVFRDIIVRSEQAFREVGLPSLARLPRTRDTRALFPSPIARVAHAQWSVTDTAEERRMPVRISRRTGSKRNKPRRVIFVPRDSTHLYRRTVYTFVISIEAYHPFRFI